MSAEQKSPAAFRCVVFDLDDTLFPERDYVFSGFAAVGRWVEKTFGDSRVAFAVRAREVFESGVRGDIFNRFVAETSQLPWREDAVAQMLEVYRKHVPALTLAPEVRELLCKLRETRRLLGVITDGWLEVQRRKVDALGLAAFVDAVVFSDALGGRAAWKPSPLPFRAIETALKVAPTECLYVGDNPAKDFLGARNAGWRSLRLRIRGGEHFAADAAVGAEADFQANSYAELSPMLLGLA